MDGIDARLVVYKIGGQAGADDQQADDGDSHCQGLHGGRVGVAGNDVKGMDVEGGHAGEVQADDRQDQHGNGNISVAGLRARGEDQGDSRKHDRHQDGGRQVDLVPGHQAVDPIGQHAGIVHGGDGQADESAADGRRAHGTA